MIPIIPLMRITAISMSQDMEGAFEGIYNCAYTIKGPKLPYVAHKSNLLDLLNIIVDQ
jgi:hypothetical protein